MAMMKYGELVLLPSKGPASHTPRITKHHETMSTQHKILTTQNIQKVPRCHQFPKYLDGCKGQRSNGTSLLLSSRVPLKPLCRKAAKMLAKVLGKGRDKLPALIQNNISIFSRAIKSRAHPWMGSSTLSRAALLKRNNTHTLQSVVAGQEHWRTAVAFEAIEVVEGSLAGEEQPSLSMLSHTHDAPEASRSQVPDPKCCLHTSPLLN